MKKYPYTESTDLIIYDQKPKKEKKQKVWLTAVCSALAASIFTAGVFGTGMYFMQKKYETITLKARQLQVKQHNRMIHHLRIQLNLQHTKR